MTEFGTILLSVVLGATPVPASAGDANYSDHALALERDARTNLGVGVRSLAFLFDAGPNNVLLVDALKEDGSWEALKELESGGFVTLSHFSASGDDFVTIILTAKGRTVASALGEP